MSRNSSGGMGWIHLSEGGNISLQRYFVNEKLSLGMNIELDKEDSHHLFTVMRTRLKDIIELVDSQQNLWLAQVINIRSKKDGTVQVVEALGCPKVEMPVSVTIACGLSKNDKLDWLVQKATELGMASFQPLALSRDVVKWSANKQDDKQDRLQKIVNNAAKQSKRLFQPQVLPIKNLNQLIEFSSAYDLKVVAYEETAKQGQHTALKHSLTQFEPYQNILCVFGAEGGLAQSEVERLLENDFISCSLGPRILRAETAPLYILSALSYYYEL